MFSTNTQSRLASVSDVDEGVTGRNGGDLRFPDFGLLTGGHVNDEKAKKNRIYCINGQT